MPDTPINPTPTPEPASQNPAEQAIPAEETKPVVEAASPDPKIQPVEEKKKLNFLFIIVIVLAIVALGLLSYIVYSEVILKEEAGSDQGGEEGEEEEGPQGPDAEEEEEEETVESFSGDFVTGEYPEGWSIVEYTNGDGTDMLTEGVTYTGLTGLHILNSDDDLVFSLEAVFGIGGIDACEEYAQFDDYNSADYDDIVAMSAENSVTTELLDYTDIDYTEFTFLDFEIRRVDKELWWDTQEGNEYFEPACGMSYGFWSLGDISYTADGDSQGAYQWDIANDATDEELLILDDILASIDTV